MIKTLNPDPGSPSGDMLPNYDPEAVLPMRRQLTDIGFSELLTSEAVDGVLGEVGSEDRGQTTLFVVNSVCGCAAGNARPGVALALQNKIIPDRLFSVFAGMEKSAVMRLRERLSPNPPSSPAMALFVRSEMVFFMPRWQIENHNAVEVADALVAEFNKHCSTAGPSIPREKYETLDMRRMCGSKLPAYAGG